MKVFIALTLSLLCVYTINGQTITDCVQLGLGTTGPPFSGV